MIFLMQEGGLEKINAVFIKKKKEKSERLVILKVLNINKNLVVERVFKRVLKKCFCMFFQVLLEEKNVLFTTLSTNVTKWC